MAKINDRNDNPRGKKSPVRLKKSLNSGLAQYAAAAVAAGVGALAAAPQAQAKVVYTPANLTLVPNKVAAFDLNHDGINDFFLIQSTIYKTGTLSIDPVRASNRIVGMSPYASALLAGVKVGPGGKFKQAHGLMATTYFFYNYGNRGPWKGNTTGYLGLKFFIHGKTHYGWASVQVTTIMGQFPGISATLTGYAYETVPNKGIVTGKTKDPDVITLPVDRRAATLGQLARGRR